MTAKKIDAMHSIFGKADGICGDCPHFLRYRYHDKQLLKCRAYGLSHSEATDWRVKWPACGLKGNMPPDGYTPVFDRIKGQKAYVPQPQCDGQVEMDIVSDGNG